jgi:glycosyltransferase involved in cell wall biosynthesis
LKTFKCFGWGGYTGQIARIKKGFAELGLTESDIEPDFIYSNDVGSHPEAIKLKNKYPNSKLVLNVLDIPEFLLPHHYNLDHTSQLLAHADVVTSISLHVQEQLVRFFGVVSTVIYQPLMGDGMVASDKNVRFIHVGRRQDKNKAYHLVQELFTGDGLNPSDLVEIGPEQGYIGNYIGVISEEELSEYYSSADFCFMPSQHEGLLLPCLESMRAGCLPVIAHNLTTREELLPREHFPEYSYTETTRESLLNFVRTVDIQHLSDKLIDYFEEFHKNKFTPSGVAGKILESIYLCKK